MLLTINGMAKLKEIRKISDKLYQGELYCRDLDKQFHYFDFIAFTGTGKAMMKYMQNGDMFYVEGRLIQTKWKNESGSSRQKTQIRIERADFTMGRNAGPKDDIRNIEGEIPEDAEEKYTDMQGLNDNLEEAVASEEDDGLPF